MDDPLAVVEMFVTLICVLKDSADVSPVLLDGFRDCHGYKVPQFLCDIEGVLIGHLEGQNLYSSAKPSAYFIIYSFLKMKITCK